MKYAARTLAFIATLTLCSFSITAEQPKAATGIWTYDYYKLSTDSSNWSGINGKAQITFLKLDSSKQVRRDQHIGISFKKWPVTPGDYRISMFPQKEDEAMIIASHYKNSFISKGTNTGHVHVIIKKGKLTFWANRVVMYLRPDAVKSHSGDWDSTYISFNLTEH